MASAMNKDVALVVSLLLSLSVVNLGLLFGVTWYFQLAPGLLCQHNFEHNRLLKAFSSNVSIANRQTFKIIFMISSVI